MPDLETVVPDTVVDDNAQTTNETVDSTPAPAETEPVKLVLGKYKTMEEAEKGIAEEQKLIGRQGDELGKLRAEVARLQEQTSLKDVLSQIAQNTNKPKEEPVLDMETFTQQLGENWVEDGKGSAKKILGVANQWVAQAEAKQRAEIDKLRSETESLKSMLNERLTELSPEYQANKEVIDAMVAEGISKTTAIKLVKKLGGKDASSNGTAQRNQPPVSVMPTRTIMNDNKPVAAHLFNPKTSDLQILANEFPEKSEKELIELATRMNAERSIRVTAGEPVNEKSFKPIAGRRI